MTFEPLSDHFLHTTFPQAPVPSVPSPPPSPSIRLLSEIPTTPLTWLWPTRIPQGHLTLLDAAPGCNPSLFTLTLAASISSGTPLPDGTPTKQSTVLLFAPYDSASATLKLSIQAAGGDPAHVLLFHPSPLPSSSSSATHTVSSHANTPTFSLPRDLPQLATTIRLFDVRLLILDPAGAIPGLARSLPALAELAQQTNCAILLVRTLRTPIANPLHSPAPPSPLLEAVRSRILLTPDPANENRTLLLTTHHLLCPSSTVLAYDTHFSTDGIPTLHFLGTQDTTQLARLCTGPLYSAHRQAILHFLQNSPTPQTIPAILDATSYDPEAGRKMLIRMKLAGELHSPARGLYGLYITPNHVSLSPQTNPALPVPNVPTISTDPQIPDVSPPQSLTLAPVPDVSLPPSLTLAPVPNVPSIPTIPMPNPPQPAVGADLSCPPPMYRPECAST